MDYEKVLGEHKFPTYEELKNGLLRLIDEGKISREDAARLLPELAESEDEKIREELISYLHSVIKEVGELGHPKIDRWIAYLEKQKEQKPELVQQPPITYIYSSDANRDERLKMALLALLNSDLIKVEGNKFTKQDLIEWVERIPTDKPAWSEEDYKMLADTIFKLAGFMGNEKNIDWLKSLRPS